MLNLQYNSPVGSKFRVCNFLDIVSRYLGVGDLGRYTVKFISSSRWPAKQGSGDLPKIQAPDVKALFRLQITPASTFSRREKEDYLHLSFFGVMLKFFLLPLGEGDSVDRIG